jgi:hypothetical protein
MSPQSSASLPSLALYSSTTQTATLETTAPTNEVLLPTHSLPIFTVFFPLHNLLPSSLQATTHLCNSIPLLPPPLNLHVRSSYRNCRFLPPEITTHTPRAPNGQTAWDNILVFVVVLSGAGIRELRQDG